MRRRARRNGRAELAPEDMALPRKRSGSRLNVGRNMRMVRLQRGWSLHEFGIRTGIKPAYVGAVERGEFNLGIDNLDHIARGLEVAPYMLLLNPEVARPLFELHVRLVRGEERVGRQRQIIERFNASARDVRLADRMLEAMVEHQRRLSSLFQTLQERPDPAAGTLPLTPSAGRPPSRRR